MKPTGYGDIKLHPVYKNSPYEVEIKKHVKAIKKLRKECSHNGMTLTKDIGLYHSYYEAFCPDCGQTWVTDNV